MNRLELRFVWWLDDRLRCRSSRVCAWRDWLERDLP